MKLSAVTLLSLARLSSSACLNTFTISAASCTFQGFLDSVQGVLDDPDCNTNSDSWLVATFGSEKSAKEAVTQACTGAYLPFGAITSKGPIFDQEYYNGGTYMNEERETINEFGITEQRLDDDPGNRITNIHDDIAQSKGITWPDDLVNFDTCDYNAAMCCFTQDRYDDGNNGNCEEPYDENCVDANPSDNTDVCYVDMTRSPISSRTSQGFALFEENAEEDSHCHGFVWSDDIDDASTRFRGNNLFFISMYDHLTQRGYARNVPGAPMCGCIEQMPVVTRSDCTQIEISNEVVEFNFNSGFLSAAFNNIDIAFNACQADPINGDDNNDLASQYEHFVATGNIAEEKLGVFAETVVGETYCREAIDSFLDSQGLAAKPACRYGEPSECGCDEVFQKDYRGDRSTTWNGLECQRWDEQSPQSHSRTRERYPEANLVDNYCRNPDNEPGGAWCYTTDPDKRWDYCGVPFCNFPEPECGTGALKESDYRGTRNITAKGYECQRWDEQAPHSHQNTPENKPDGGLVENYCRNPDNDERAWCYTTDPDKRFDYCNVASC